MHQYEPESSHFVARLLASYAPFPKAVPERMRPRIETLPVKGHFLSMYDPVQKTESVYRPTVEHSMTPRECRANICFAAHLQ